MSNQTAHIGTGTYIVPSNPTLADFHYIVFRASADNKGRMRFGQLLFDVLYEMRRDLATKIVSTNADPFYNESREQLDRFYTFIAKEW